MGQNVECDVLLTPAEAAVRAGVDTETVLQWINEGYLAATKKAGLNRVRLTVLIRFLKRAPVYGNRCEHN